MAGTVWAIQRNGERLSVERWAYRAWLFHRLTDPLICRILDGAVTINLDPGFPRPELLP